MDSFADFLKVNSQSLFTLLGVLIGSLIPFWIHKHNLKAQILEHDKDRREQRREAKTQLALELMRNDVKVIEESIDTMLKGLAYIEAVTIRRYMDGLSQQEMEKEIFAIGSQFYKVGETDRIGNKLAQAQGDEFYSIYQSFLQLSREYIDMHMEIEPGSYSAERAGRLLAEITSIAGEIHNRLAQKIIALRDE